MPSGLGAKGFVKIRFKVKISIAIVSILAMILKAILDEKVTLGRLRICHHSP
jgi:hypothetical protein